VWRPGGWRRPGKDGNVRSGGEHLKKKWDGWEIRECWVLWNPSESLRTLPERNKSDSKGNLGRHTRGHGLRQAGGELEICNVAGIAHLHR